MSSTLPLPVPHRLPSTRRDLTNALRTAEVGAGFMAELAEPDRRALLRKRMWRLLEEWERAHTGCDVGHRAGAAAHRLDPSAPAAEAEQQEHDRYFAVTRIGGDAGVAFVAGLVLAHVSAYEDCVSMGVTLLDETQWGLLFGGLQALSWMADEQDSGPDDYPAAPPLAPQWRDPYDPGKRWLIGHQLFFALIQGAIVGLNCYLSASSVGAAEEVDKGLDLAAVFMRGSAAAMRYTSDFAAVDYDAIVRPAMAPPVVRAGFSGLQTRDHAHLVRLFAAVRPMLATGGRTAAYEAFVESVVAAYQAHEFICARFRGDVLPSLRMAATTRGTTQRSGVAVIRDMMRARLRLIDPAAGSPAGPAVPPDPVLER
jgi:hypothetical protein